MFQTTDNISSVAMYAEGGGPGRGVRTFQVVLPDAKRYSDLV